MSVIPEPITELVLDRKVVYRLALNLISFYEGSEGDGVAQRLVAGKAKASYASALTAYTYAPHHAKLTYKPDDFEYLSLVALNSSGFISKPDKPWNTLKEAFKWAKEKNNGTMISMFHGADDRDAILRMA